ncbi:MAG: hypothetical protein AVDCRST_MAG93-7599 [uncultured Chloroflexia bacterium]|uniref:Uncharacterized protein n=1 Tax=uncultured Chloroflexia bacterium TaxID=1672391 RepID=A0A6J4MJH5_9CHLR|nr:MAG: hypothetical protein AVDCRST_MAG93-7599 [uncultured Chloroflexia bacterium]
MLTRDKDDTSCCSDSAKAELALHYATRMVPLAFDKRKSQYGSGMAS